MISTTDLIVISDLHLAAERDRGLFRADTDLADFLLWVFEEAKDSFLVLNGDILDFLVGENGSKTITIDEADLKVKRIIEHHPEVFDALTEIAHSPKHQLFILSGNHDPELANPIAQSIIEERLRGKRFTPNIRWVTGGNALLTQVGNSKILIEHGDLFDDFNRVDYGELHRSTAHLSRMLDFDSYKVPPGSSLVENSSPLRQKYPWIDSIKPISRKTFPLIWAFAKQELNSQQLEMFQKVILDGVDAGSNWLIRKGKEIFGISPFLDSDDSFAEWRNEEIQDPTTLSEREIAKLIRRLKKVSAEDGSFDVEGVEDNPLKNKYLKKYAREKQISAVIHGHTHSAKSYAIPNGDVLGLSSELLYLNSGTWGRLLQLPKKENSDDSWKEFLNNLDAGVDNSFNRLTFVRITQDTKIKAFVNEWKSKAKEPLEECEQESVKKRWQGRIKELSVKYLDESTKTWK